MTRAGSEAADAGAGRIEGRAERDRGRVDVAARVDLVAAGAQELRGDHLAGRVLHVAEAHRPPDRLAPGRRGQLAHRDALAQQQLTAPEHGSPPVAVRVPVPGRAAAVSGRIAGPVAYDHRYQPPPGPLGPRLLHRFPAEERNVAAQLAG